MSPVCARGGKEDVVVITTGQGMNLATGRTSWGRIGTPFISPASALVQDGVIATLATRMAAQLLNEGICVIGFSFPVVPNGQARIRVQVSAANTRGELDFAMDAFARVRQTCE